MKSAGNGRERNEHATVTVNKGGQADLKWDHPKGNAFRDDIELWFEPFGELRFMLISPNGESTRQIGPNELKPDNGSFSSGNTFDLQYVRHHKDNGHSLLRITVTAGTAKSIVSGEFNLQIQSKAQSVVTLDCWIETNLNNPAQFTNHQDENRTLSVPGTANSVLSVGAVDRCRPLVVGDFSAYGKTRDGRQKPEIVAPGIEIVTARSGTAKGVIRDSGTSMAAPHVSGAVVLSLSACEKLGGIPPNAAQISGALISTTQNGNGLWDRGSGYGLIDTNALLRALVASRTRQALNPAETL